LRTFIKKTPCDVNREPNLIEKFLGEDVLSHPLISKSKLTEDDKKSLDLPLTIAELDKALTEANKKSAPGIDGLSMQFIEKFWYLLRVPLFNYANTCFAKGRLTYVFRTIGGRYRCYQTYTKLSLEHLITD
jgi:hypothetical protein